MRYLAFQRNGRLGPVVGGDGHVRGVTEDQTRCPGLLERVAEQGRRCLDDAAGAFSSGEAAGLATEGLLPLPAAPGQVIRVGSNSLLRIQSRT